MSDNRYLTNDNISIVEDIEDAFEPENGHYERRTGNVSLFVYNLSPQHAEKIKEFALMYYGVVEKQTPKQIEETLPF
jgi:hypothetical protein